MVSGKNEAVPLQRAARMLGVSDRRAAALLKQNKLAASEVAPARSGRGRPPIYVTRASVEEYARATFRVLREVSAEELRGRHAGLSRWLTENARLMGRIERARIADIDGQGSGGQVWVRFHLHHGIKRDVLACFWRADARGGLFGARRFRIEVEGDEAHVFLRSTDEELDRAELARAVSLAASCVGREEARLEESRELRNKKG